MGRKSFLSPPVPQDFEPMHNPGKIGEEHFCQICTWFNNGINVLSIVHKLRCTHGWHINGESLSKSDVYTVLIYAAKLGLINVRLLTNYVEQKLSRINKTAIRRLPAELVLQDRGMAGEDGEVGRVSGHDSEGKHSSLAKEPDIHILDYFGCDGEYGTSLRRTEEETSSSGISSRRSTTELQTGSNRTRIVSDRNATLEHYYNAVSLFRAGYTPTQISEFSLGFPNVATSTGVGVIETEPNSYDIKSQLVRLSASRKFKVRDSQAGRHVNKLSCHTFNELLECNGYLKPRRYLRLYPLSQDELTDEMVYDLNILKKFFNSQAGKRYTVLCDHILKAGTYTELLKSSGFIFNSTVYPGFKQSGAAENFDITVYLKELPIFLEESEEVVKKIAKRNENVTSQLKELGLQADGTILPYQSRPVARPSKNHSVLDSLHKQLIDASKEEIEDDEPLPYEPPLNKAINEESDLIKNIDTIKDGDNLVVDKVRRLKLMSFLNVKKEEAKKEELKKEQESTISKVVTDINAGVADALEGFE